MCERCDKAREDMWAEIRDLLNYNRKVKGPLSLELEESVNRAIARGMPDEEVVHATEMLRVEMITIRCAFIARAIPGQEFHRMPPSVIMGIWAGTTMQAERAIVLDKLLGSLLRREDDDA